MKIIATVVASMCFILLSLTALNAREGAVTPRGTVKLDSIKDVYKPVLFNHEKHASIAGDCGKCHHQHGSNSSMPCRECHAVKAQSFKGSVTGNFMACKNCHGTYDPAMPGMPGLKVSYHRQCFQCHRGMGDVGTSPKGCTTMCHDKRDQKVSAKAEKAR